MSLTQQDLNVRLQLLNCCIGTQTATVVDKIKIGAKDANCKLQNLQVMQKMLDYIKCYKISIPETLSEGSFQITTLTIGYTLEILIDGVVIFPETVSITSNRNLAMDAIVTYINANQDVYTATLDTTNDLYVVKLTGPCTGGDITYVTDGTKGEIVLSVTDLANGVCGYEYDNCLTEDQVIAMIDWMSNKCNLCFQPPGFLYE